MNPNELEEAAAAKFSSLPTPQKHLLVTSANYTSHAYRSKHVQLCRQEKKTQSDWNPYLRIKDLMMLGDLDLMEAKKSYKEPYFSKSFEARLQIHRTKQLEDRVMQFQKSNWSEEPPELEPQKFASDYNEESFVDTKFSEFDRDDVKKETRRKLLHPEQRKDMLAQVESRREKIEWAMKKRVNKRVTRKERMSIQSDDERKNMPANIEMYQMQIQRAMKKRMSKKAEFNQSVDTETKHLLESYRTRRADGREENQQLE